MFWKGLVKLMRHKKIEALSSNVVSLQDVLTDKKSRGIFGEVQLYQILASVFGEKTTNFTRSNINFQMAQ